MSTPPEARYRYFVQVGDEPEREVSKTEFVAAERRFGFHNKMGRPDEPGTAGFGVSIPGHPEVHGRIELTTDWNLGPEIYFMLDEGGQLQRTTDSTEAHLWHRNNPERRRVGLTLMPDGRRISTVLTRHDQNFTGIGPPRPFETMMFDGTGDPRYKETYSTWEEAEAGHAQVVQELRDGTLFS